MPANQPLEEYLYAVTIRPVYEVTASDRETYLCILLSEKKVTSTSNHSKPSVSQAEKQQARRKLRKELALKRVTFNDAIEDIIIQETETSSSAPNYRENPGMEPTRKAWFTTYTVSAYKILRRL